MCDFPGLAPQGAVLILLRDGGQAIALHPAEAPAVARAVPKRRREFALGRACARAALAKLGHPGAIVGRQAAGAPVWPPGFAGAITHTRGLAAALVGRAGDFAGLGLDAEWAGGVDAPLARRLFADSEIALLAGMDAAQRRIAATLLFSAREAYYKAFHPLTGESLGFRHVEVTLPGGLSGDGVFHVRQPGRPDRWGQPLAGRYAVQDDLIVTAIAIA